MFESVEPQEDFQLYYNKNEDFSKLKRIPLKLWTEHFRKSDKERNKFLSMLFDSEVIKMKTLYCFLEESQILGKTLQRFGIPNVCGKINRKLLLPYSRTKSKNCTFEKVTRNKFKIPIAKERNLKVKGNNKPDKQTHRYPSVAERWSDVAIRKFKTNVGSKEHISQSYTFNTDECEINLQCENPHLNPRKDVDSTSAQRQHTSYNKTEEIETYEFEKQPEISEYTHKTDDTFSFVTENEKDQLPMEHTSKVDEYKTKYGFELKPKDLKYKVGKSVRFNDNDLCTFAPTQVSIEKFFITQESVDNEFKDTKTSNSGDAEIKTKPSITTQEPPESLQNYMLDPPESESHLKDLNDINLSQPNIQKENNENRQFDIEPYDDNIIIDESSFSSVSDVSKHMSNHQEITINLEASYNASNREKKSMDIKIQNNDEEMCKKSSDALQKERLSKEHDSFIESQSFSQNKSNNLSQIIDEIKNTTVKSQTQINSTINLENNIVNDIYSENTKQVNEYSDDEYIPLSPPNQTVYINIETLIKSRLGGSNHANENSLDLKHFELVNGKQLTTQDSIVDYDLDKTLELSPGLSDRDYFSISSDTDEEIQGENHDIVFVQSNLVTSIDKINVLNNDNDASLPPTGHLPLSADREILSLANISCNEIENLIPIQDQLIEINNHTPSIIRTETPYPVKPDPNTDYLQTKKNKPILEKTSSIEKNCNAAKTLTCSSQSEFTPSTNKSQVDNNAPITNAPSKNNISSFIPPLNDKLEIGLDEANKNQEVFHSNDFQVRRVLFSDSSHSFPESINKIHQSINKNLIAQSLENIKAITSFKEGTENNVENATKKSPTLNNSLNFVSEHKIKKYSTLASDHTHQFNNENINLHCLELCLSQKPNNTTNYPNEHSSVLKTSNFNEGLNEEEELIHSLLDQQDDDIYLHVNVTNNFPPTGPSPLFPNASTLLSSKGVDFDSVQDHDSESTKPNLITSKIDETTQHCEQNIQLSLQQDLEAVKGNVSCKKSNKSGSNTFENITSVKCIPQVNTKISSDTSKGGIHLQSTEQAKEEQKCTTNCLNDGRKLVTDLEPIPYIACSNKLRLVGPKNNVCENRNVTDAVNINPILSRKFTDGGAKMNEMESTDIVHSSANRVPDECHIDNSLLSTADKLIISDNSQIENPNDHINKHTFEESGVILKHSAFSNTKIKKETKTGLHNIDTIRTIGIIYNDLQTSPHKNIRGKNVGSVSSSTTTKQLSECANIGSVRSQEGSFSNACTVKQVKPLIKFVTSDQKLAISNSDQSNVGNDVTLEKNHDIGTVVTNPLRVKRGIPGSSNVKKNNRRFAKANNVNIKVFSPSRQPENKNKIAVSSTTLSGVLRNKSGLEAEKQLWFKSATNIKIAEKENNKAILNTSDSFSEKRIRHLHLKCKKKTLDRKPVNMIGSLMGLTTDKINTSYVCKTSKTKANKNLNTVMDRIQNKNKGIEDRFTNNAYKFDDLFPKSQTTNSSSHYGRGFPKEQTFADEQLDDATKNENSSATSSLFCGTVESSSQDSFYEKYNKRVFNDDSPGSHTSNEDSILITSNGSSPLINYYSINKCSKIGKPSESKYSKQMQKRKCTNSSPLSNLFDNEELSNKRQKINNINKDISSQVIDQSEESESYLNNGEVTDCSDYEVESPSENGWNKMMDSDHMSDSAHELNGSAFPSMTDTSSATGVHEEYEDLFDD